MQTKTVTQEMREKLNAPLPDEAVKAHPTKTYLSSIKAIYVTERLNDVFGVGSWRIKVEEAKVGEKGMVVVKVIFEIPEYGIYLECFGGNDNGGDTSKNFDLGDAYKGATTDALTKIGSWLEIGIDVFKGKHGAKQPQPKQQTQPKPQPQQQQPSPKPKTKLTEAHKKEWQALNEKGGSFEKGKVSDAMIAYNNNIQAITKKGVKIAQVQEFYDLEPEVLEHYQMLAK